MSLKCWREWHLGNTRASQSPALGSACRMSILEWASSCWRGTSLKPHRKLLLNKVRGLGVYIFTHSVNGGGTSLFSFPGMNFKIIVHHSKVDHLRLPFSFPGITSPLQSLFFSLQSKGYRKFTFPMSSSERNISQKPQGLRKKKYGKEYFESCRWF